MFDQGDYCLLKSQDLSGIFIIQQAELFSTSESTLPWGSCSVQNHHNSVIADKSITAYFHFFLPLWYSKTKKTFLNIPFTLLCYAQSEFWWVASHQCCFFKHRPSLSVSKSSSCTGSLSPIRSSSWFPSSFFISLNSSPWLIWFLAPTKSLSAVNNVTSDSLKRFLIKLISTPTFSQFFSRTW